jgi:hypothetical protein
MDRTSPFRSGGDVHKYQNTDKLMTVDFRSRPELGHPGLRRTTSPKQGWVSGHRDQPYLLSSSHDSGSKQTDTQCWSKGTRVCMYVVCNHDPGPSVLVTPDPRCTDRFRVKCQHPNSQSPHTSDNVQNCVLSPTTSS